MDTENERLYTHTHTQNGILFNSEDLPLLRKPIVWKHQGGKEVEERKRH